MKQITEQTAFAIASRRTKYSNRYDGMPHGLVGCRVQDWQYLAGIAGGHHSSVALKVATHVDGEYQEHILRLIKCLTQLLFIVLLQKARHL